METVHRVMLGSRNGAKARGVQAAFQGLRTAIQGPDLESLETWTCQVETGVNEEPWGFPATVQGAQNRARAAFEFLGIEDAPSAGVAFGIGVESGFIEVTPAAFTLYNFDVCCLFDGSCDYFGISPGFEYPRRLVRDIFLHRQPFQAARQYITTSPDIERQGGIVGVLAAGHIDRPEMTRLATHMALIRYLQRHDYARWS